MERSTFAFRLPYTSNSESNIPISFANVVIAFGVTAVCAISKSEGTGDFVRSLAAEYIEVENLLIVFDNPLADKAKKCMEAENSASRK